MRMVKDKQLLMAADFAGYPLKEAIKSIWKTRAGPSPILALRPIPIPMIPS